MSFASDLAARMAHGGSSTPLSDIETDINALRTTIAASLATQAGTNEDEALALFDSRLYDLGQELASQFADYTDP